MTTHVVAQLHSHSRAATSSWREWQADLHRNVLQGHKVLAKSFAHHCLRESRDQAQVHQGGNEGQDTSANIAGIDPQQMADEGIPFLVVLGITVDAWCVVVPFALVDKRLTSIPAEGIAVGNLICGGNAHRPEAHQEENYCNKQQVGAQIWPRWSMESLEHGQGSDHATQQSQNWSCSSVLGVIYDSA